MAAKRGAWGTTRKLTSGRWQARYQDPDTGVRASASTTFATRADAQRWLARARTDLDRGVFKDPAPSAAVSITVTEYVNAYLGRRPELSPRTLESYRRGLRLYIEPRLGDVPLAKVSADRVADWWADLIREMPGERGRTSRVRAYELLRATFAEAVANRVLEATPCRLKVHKKAAPRPFVSVEQVRQLVGEMPERWQAGVLLAASTGLRFGEISGLRERHLDLLHKRITVDGQLLTLEDGSRLQAPTKTEAGRRTIALPPHLIPLLRAHLDSYGHGDPDAFLFTTTDGVAVPHRAWNYRWDRARTAAGLPGARFHDLRHAALTLLAQSGATLAELMAYAGHSAPAAALRYQKVAESRADLLAERLSAAWGAVLPTPSTEARASGA